MNWVSGFVRIFCVFCVCTQSYFWVKGLLFIVYIQKAYEIRLSVVKDFSVASEEDGIRIEMRMPH